MKRAVFPGSFDPLTLGHSSVVKRGLKLFDEIIIALGTNDSKSYLFTLEQRISFIKETFINYPSIKVMSYSGLTVDFCKTVDADFILRGLRNPADFEFEKSIGQANKKLTGIETVFLLTDLEYGFISSSIVRDVMKNGGDYTHFVPKAVKK